MADKDPKGAEPQEGGGGGKKTMVVFALIVLLAIGASVGGTLFFLGGSEPEAVVDAAPAKPQAAIYHNLRPAFIINYATGSKPRFLQADLTVMARDPSVVEALVDHAPLVRSRIVEFLTDQDFFTLQTHEGKENMREGLRELLDETLREQEQIAGVQSVLLTNFVMQ